MKRTQKLCFKTKNLNWKKYIIIMFKYQKNIKYKIRINFKIQFKNLKRVQNYLNYQSIIKIKSIPNWRVNKKNRFYGNKE